MKTATSSSFIAPSSSSSHVARWPWSVWLAMSAACLLSNTNLAIAECDAKWCRSPDGAGGYECWAGWAGQKCLCEVNKIGATQIHTYPKLTGNVKDKTGLLHGARTSRVYEYICCDERDDDTILPSCGDYIGFRDKTISHDSTKAAAIFNGNGGIYIGSWTFDRLEVCSTELVNGEEVSTCQDFSAKGPESESFYWVLSAANEMSYKTITCDANFDRIIAGTESTASNDGLITVGTFNPISAIHEWSMLGSPPGGVSWHSFVSDDNAVLISASDKNNVLYHLTFHQSGMDYSKQACEHTYSAIRTASTDSTTCFDAAASVAGFSYTGSSSFCTQWITYNRGLVSFDRSLVQCLNGKVTLSQFEYTTASDFTAYSWVKTDQIYVSGWGYVLPSGL